MGVTENQFDNVDISIEKFKLKTKTPRPYITAHTVNTLLPESIMQFCQ